MKRFIYLVLVLAVVLGISACGTQAVPTTSPEAVQPVSIEETGVVETEVIVETAVPVEQVALDFDYVDALSPRLLLALGTLELADTPVSISPEQAPELLMLWQTLDNLTRSGTGADAEVTALLLQIEQSLAPQQVETINAMRLTQIELQRWAAENGITVGAGTGTGQGTGQGMGQGANLTAEEKATRQALNGEVGNNENGLSTSITQFLITYLQNLE